jgi:hypothetical protein
MKLVSRIGLGISLAIATPVAVTGCISEDPVVPQQTGTVSAALTGVSTQGFEYRLRQGVLTIVGPTNTSINTEDHLGSSVIQVQLQTGNYTIQLADGWQLERNESGMFVPVDANLTSANPAAFSISNGQTTTVALSFRVDGDDVTMGRGTLDIVLDVNDNPQENTASRCSDGLDNDADGFVDCSDFDCAPFCGGGAENTASRCSDGIDNDLDGFVDCSDFDCTPFCP